MVHIFPQAFFFSHKDTHVYTDTHTDIYYIYVSTCTSMLYQIKADIHERERGGGWKKGLKRSGCSQFFIVPRQTKHTYTHKVL